MKIHLIGIGGIGVSAIAQYYLSKGYQVSGSDLVKSEITDFLKKKGIKIIIGNSEKNIKKDIDLVVYSPAVKKNSPELLKAKNYNIKAMSYPKALGELTKEYYTIAVAGAHGKSTTASMIALTMIKAKLDPTVIVGTKLKEFGGSNFRAGKSKFLVIEACEYDSSFLQYFPNIAVVTNVDKEHLDFFKTLANVKKAFKSFILKTDKDGYFVFNLDNKYIPKIKNPKFKVLPFSIKQKEVFQLSKILNVPGKHNIYNALATIAVAKILGIPSTVYFKALGQFKGTWRRFESKQAVVGNPPSSKTSARQRKIIIISDYAHHPNEVSATLQATREKYPDKKIWCIFQPHQHQRTHYLFNDFVKIFRKMPINGIVITDIYDVAGRETKTINSEVSSEKLVKKINKKDVFYCATKNLEKEIINNIGNNDVLIIMGAGDIYKLFDKF
ncbi:MAG: UDP-N-acetylmuramate--L-alanine ligase [Candidatus Staskawiczbacteria bacterium]|jgi:UDP-N-acetylmuramate--alanine ligase